MTDLKTYIVTTGITFVLVLVAHLARLYAEGFHLLREPTFAFTSLLSIALSVWAWRLFRRLSKPDDRA
jgi:hypothetical protein